MTESPASLRSLKARTSTLYVIHDYNQLLGLETNGLNQLISEGSAKLASVPSGGSGGAAAAPSGGAASGGAAAAAAPAEEKAEEKEESDEDMGFGLFD